MIQSDFTCFPTIASQLEKTMLLKSTRDIRAWQFTNYSQFAKTISAIDNQCVVRRHWTAPRFQNGKHLITKMILHLGYYQFTELIQATALGARRPQVVGVIMRRPTQLV